MTFLLSVPVRPTYLSTIASTFPPSPPLPQHPSKRFRGPPNQHHAVRAPEHHLKSAPRRQRRRRRGVVGDRAIAGLIAPARVAGPSLGPEAVALPALAGPGRRRAPAPQPCRAVGSARPGPPRLPRP